ncbi:MAG: sugar phosphate nucleotidyltransferase [Candidatus Saccharimonas sp.]
MQRPTKAIIAAAGFGTRFLPQTKAMPKEMLPIVDKPIIQYVVEELVDAGIKDIILVGSSNKRAIEDHFDVPNEDLVANLLAGGEKKRPLLDQVNEIANLANFVYLRQKGAYGNATPVACAAHLIGNEPFIYTFADDFFVAKPGRTKQLIETFTKYNGQVLACKTIEQDDEYSRYGIVAGEHADDTTIKVERVVEKPGKTNAPSNLASVSGYLLTPEIFEYIDKAVETFNGHGELMLQPILQSMIDDGYGVFAREIVHGRFYDTGDKLEYLKTVVDFGLKDPKLGPEFAKYLKSHYTKK